MLEKMDTTSYPNSSFSFMHAMQNGFYSTKNPTQEAKSIYQTFSKDSTFTKYAAQMTYNAPMAFWKNEKSTTLHLTETNQNLVKSNICIYGINGQQDGLYSKKQKNDLGSLIGSGNILNLENCSHSVFVDQQKQFISAGQNWTSK
jgi:proline iminopeptidase